MAGNSRADCLVVRDRFEALPGNEREPKLSVRPVPVLCPTRPVGVLATLPGLIPALFSRLPLSCRHGAP